MHTTDCAIHQDGPCTCGYYEWLEEVALEEATPLHSEEAVLEEVCYG